MLSVLFPQSLDDGDEMSRALHATMQGSSSLKVNTGVRRSL